MLKAAKRLTPDGVLVVKKGVPCIPKLENMLDTCRGVLTADLKERRREKSSHNSAAAADAGFLCE
jgi:hypothetical protein